MEGIKICVSRHIKATGPETSQYFVRNKFIKNFDEMKSLYFLLPMVLLITDHVHASSPIAFGKHRSYDTRSDKIEGQVARVKRSPLFKLPLLAGAALIGKKAILLGGAAIGAKALVGAGILGAGLYKAKYYSGGYSGGYASYQYAPATAYVESNWG
ncbi:unnamed protein product [Xylocopa violacea]|uniref:Uncharacterized protein n=1 Tax=Xylocopa violacea TaxID=135666 RepID=A0ABP1NPG4_XYLVO